MFQMSSKSKTFTQEEVNVALEKSNQKWSYELRMAEQRFQQSLMNLVLETYQLLEDYSMRVELSQIQ